jgi:hypothetical protein
VRNIVAAGDLVHGFAVTVAAADRLHRRVRHLAKLHRGKKKRLAYRYGESSSRLIEDGFDAFVMPCKKNLR